MNISARVDEIRTKSPATALDFAPDGKTLAAAHESWPWKKSIADAPQFVLYNPVDGRVLAEIRRKETTGLGVVFAGGMLWQLVRRTEDTDSELWVSALDGRESKRLASWDMYDLDAKSLVRDPEGRFVAVAGRRTEVWDASSRKRIARFGGKERMDSQVHFPEQAAALVPGRPWLWLYGSEPGRLVLHDFRLGTELVSWPAPYRSGRDVRVSPDGRILLSFADNFYGAIVQDTLTGKRLLEESFPTGQHLKPAAITGDGRLLVTLDYGGVKAWTLPDGKPLKKLPPVTADTTCAAAADQAPLVAFGASPDRILVLDVVD